MYTVLAENSSVQFILGIRVEKNLSPGREEIRAERNLAGLTQSQAARLIHSKLRTWQDWEAGIAQMHPGLWELFLIKIEYLIKDKVTKQV